MWKNIILILFFIICFQKIINFACSKIGGKKMTKKLWYWYGSKNLDCNIYTVQLLNMFNIYFVINIFIMLILFLL